MKNIAIILCLNLFYLTVQASEYFETIAPVKSEYTLVRSIATDAHGIKWFVTQNGVTRFDGKQWTTVAEMNSDLSSDRVRTLIVDKENTKWFATDKGVSKFDGLNWTRYTSLDGLVHNEVNCIALDMEGNKWFGTQNGVSKFDGHSWTNYSAQNELSNPHVTCITVDRYDNKWFGTVNGVSKFDGHSWLHYTQADGLSYGAIESIAIDASGSIWLCTKTGIVKLREDSPQECNFNAYLKSRDSNSVLEGIAKPEVEKESKFDGSVWTYYTTENGMATNQISSLEATELHNELSNVNVKVTSPDSSAVNELGKIEQIQLFLSMTADIVYLKTSLDNRLITVYNGTGKMIYLKQNDKVTTDQEILDGYYEISFRNKDGKQKIVQTLNFK